MSKSLTRTVLALPQASHPVVSGIAYDSGPLAVGDLVELSINFSVVGNTANVASPNWSVYIVDALDVKRFISAPFSLGIAAGISFGDTIGVMVTPGVNGSPPYNTDTQATFGLSIEGK